MKDVFLYLCFVINVTLFCITMNGGIFNVLAMFNALYIIYVMSDNRRYTYKLVNAS